MNRFLLTLFLVFSGKIRKEEKNTGSYNPAWHVSAHPVKSSVPQRPVPWGPQKPRSDIVLRQSFTGPACGPDPWLPYLLARDQMNLVIVSCIEFCIQWLIISWKKITKIIRQLISTNLKRLCSLRRQHKIHLLKLCHEIKLLYQFFFIGLSRHCTFNICSYYFYKYQLSTF